jgi:hypothetical protein
MVNDNFLSIDGIDHNIPNEKNSAITAFQRDTVFPIAECLLYGQAQPARSAVLGIAANSSALEHPKFSAYTSTL